MKNILWGTKVFNRLSSKMILLLFVTMSLFNFVSAQNSDEIGQLVNEGINLYDEGQFTEAIAKYDEALALDSINLSALSEKALTFMAIEKYDEAIELSKLAIQYHPGDENLNMVYVNYAICYDELLQTEKAIEVYNEGIAEFPDLYLLHFNKGLSLFDLERNDEALECIKKSMTLNPEHAGSQNSMSKMSVISEKKIPAILASCRFLILEPKGPRAENSIFKLLELLNGGAIKTGRNQVTVVIDPSVFADTLASGENADDNFMHSELLLAMSSAQDFDRKFKNETPRERFIRKMGVIFISLDEVKNDNHGFFWEYYVPYFIDLQVKGYMETFSYIVFASSEDEQVTEWLDNHSKELDDFYQWSQNYQWMK
jgi:tetratricopeptide (TPR) repeat protein